MNNNKVLKTMETKRLILEPISNKYLKEIYEHFSDPDVTEYMDIKSLKSQDEAKEIIDFYLNKKDDQDHYRWVILRKEDHELLGTCGINTWKKQRANKCEIGYDLSKKYWRKGYTTEALDKLLNHIFNNLNIKRVEALVIKENLPSCKVLEKLNFTKEGLLRANHNYNGEFVDEYMYSLLREEYT